MGLTTIHISCKVQEKKEIEEKAKKIYKGKNVLSKYILDVVLRSSSKQDESMYLQNHKIEILGDYLIQLQGIARNINQQTRALHQQQHKIDIEQQGTDIKAIIQTIKGLIATT